MAIHQTALYIGMVASGFIAGYIGEILGWRAAFLSFGLVGILWVILLLFRLKETTSVNQKIDKPPFKEVFLYLRRKPIFLMLSLAFGGYQFAMVGYLTWMPTFLHEKFNLSLSDAGFSSVFYFSLFAVIGVLIGGRFSDRLSKKRKQIRMEVEYISLILGAPFIFWMGKAENLFTIYITFCGLGFFRGIYDSNLFAALFDFIEPRYRSSATGLMLSIAFVISSISPILLGWIKQNASLRQGFPVLGFAFILSSIIIFLALKLFFRASFINIQVQGNTTNEVM